MVCGNYGDFYLTTETPGMLFERASNAIEKGVEFEVINLQPAAQENNRSPVHSHHPHSG